MTLWQDVRFALRLLVKDRWFTAAAVAALALGLGMNTTVFTLVNAVLIRGLPFPEADRILHLDTRLTSSADDGMGVSLLDYRDWRAARAFDALGAWTDGTMNLADPGRLPERVRGTWVTANTFGLLRQPPLVGRDFTAADEAPGAEPVVILGHGVWQERYGGDSNVLGRLIRVNDLPATVVGVMPEGMSFPTNTRVWMPLTETAEDAKRDHRRLQAFGRLRQDSTRSHARAELAGITAALAGRHPDTNRDTTILDRTFNERFNGGPIRLIFLTLMGAVGFLLLIACANVANLLLARSVERAREVAVRVALGATRAAILRQLLVESVLLSLVGSLIGLGLAAGGVRAFERAVANVGKPYWIQFSMDWTVFAFLAAIGVTTGIVFGLAPALHVSRTNVNDILKQGGRGHAGGGRSRRLASAMVVFQVALTLVLLTGAGLMVRSFIAHYRLDTGFAAANLLTMRFNLAERKYPDAEARGRVLERLSEALADVPNVRTVLVSHMPMGGWMPRRLDIEGRPVRDTAAQPGVGVVLIGDDYFETLGVPLRRGRAFGKRDGTPGSETVVLSERFVAHFFPSDDPIGRRIRLTDGDRPPGPWLTVIGVGPTIRQDQLRGGDPEPILYLPYRSDPRGFATILARGTGDVTRLTGTLRHAVQGVDADLPVYDVITFEARLAELRWPYRVFGTLFTVFAITALVLSTLGVYGVMAYAVSQRRQEIGIRMALGAGGRQVALGVLRGGLIQLSLGLVLGLAGAYGVGRLLAGVLVDQRGQDPATVAVVVALLAAVTLAACFIPARRATLVDPLTALRAE